jgi:hypothetical protein
MTRMQTMQEWREMQTRNFLMAVRFAQGHRSPRRKPRDPVEDRILYDFAVASVRERAASGKVVRIGPRHYEYRTGAEMRALAGEPTRGEDADR